RAGERAPRRSPEALAGAVGLYSRVVCDGGEGGAAAELRRVTPYRAHGEAACGPRRRRGRKAPRGGRDPVSGSRRPTAREVAPPAASRQPPGDSYGCGPTGSVTGSFSAIALASSSQAGCPNP